MQERCKDYYEHDTTTSVFLSLPRLIFNTAVAVKQARRYSAAYIR